MTAAFACDESRAFVSSYRVTGQLTEKAVAGLRRESSRPLSAHCIVDELTIIIAPVIMGGSKRLFDGFTRSPDLEHLGVRQSPVATFIDYRVKR